MLAPSFKNLPETLSTPASLELSIFIIFYTFSSEVLFMQISFEIVKLQQYLITDCKLYSLGELGSLIRRNSAKFEKKSVKIFGDRTCVIGQIIISSIALKLEITVLFGISRGVTRILWVYQSLLRAALQKKGLFFRAVNFKASYSDFLYNLSTWSLSLLNFLKR